VLEELFPVRVQEALEYISRHTKPAGNRLLLATVQRVPVRLCAVETALRFASMFVGGLAGKIAVKYGLRWGKAAALGRRIAELGGDLIDGVNGLIRANRKVDNLACPLGNSFVPGTRVVMADGATKPIEEVDVGEEVLATDPETGEQTARTVLATIIGSGSKHLVEITVDPATEREAADEGTGSETEGEQAEQPGVPGPVTAGDVVIATDEHPFWVPDLEQWVDAVDLAPGMWLQTSAGTWVQIGAVQAWTQAATVHNLTVQGVHTYHVGAGSLDVLSHNQNGFCPAGLKGTVDDLHDLLPSAAQGRRTTAGVRGTDEGGAVYDVYAAGGTANMTAAQRGAAPGLTVSTGRRNVHAEVAALDGLNATGGSPLSVAASRPFCSSCQQEIANRGGTIVSDTVAVWFR
jgi:hypothetical protein